VLSLNPGLSVNTLPRKECEDAAWRPSSPSSAASAAGGADGFIDGSRAGSKPERNALEGRAKVEVWNPRKAGVKAA
jgi:hypothetical protein